MDIEDDFKELYKKIGLIIVIVAIIQGVVLFSGSARPKLNVGDTQANPDTNIPILRCEPPVVLGKVGEIAAFAASGGSGQYTWNAPGGNPSTGTGDVFSTRYNSRIPQTRKVTVSTGKGQTYQESSCLVTL